MVIVVVVMVMIMIMVMAVVMVMIMTDGRDGGDRDHDRDGHGGDACAGGRRVGAAFRLERRVDRNELRAEALQQRLDRRIALEPQPPLQHLHRHVTVAEMPGQPRQRRKVGGARLDQRLGLGHHLDQAAVVEHQRVVGAKPHRLGEIELDAGAFDAEQEALLRLALRVAAGSAYRRPAHPCRSAAGTTRVARGIGDP